MGIRVWNARLTDREIQDLTQCLTWLNSVHDSINATGMAGKRAVMELCASTYHVIEHILARQQGIVISFQRRQAEAEKTTGGQGDS